MKFLSLPIGGPINIDLLEFAALIATGFTSCAEFGSYAFVHPVIRNLPPEGGETEVISNQFFRIPISDTSGLPLIGLVLLCLADARRL